MSRAGLRSTAPPCAFGRCLALALALSLFACAASPAVGQDAPAPSEAPGDADSSKIDDLLGALDAEQERLEYGSAHNLLSVHGFVDVVYSDAAGPGSFDAYHTNLFFDAYLHPQVQGVIEIEYEHSGEEIHLDKALVQIRPLVDDPRLHVSAGRDSAPFGIERRTWYAPLTTFVTRPTAFREIVPGSWYETGIFLNWVEPAGALPYSVELALTNGLGDEAATDIREARQAEDNNHDKTVTVHASVRPSSTLELGASASTGHYDDDGEARATFVGLDFEASIGRLDLRAELVHSELETAGGSGAEISGIGGYLLASLAIFESDQRQWDCSLRFDYSDRDRDLGDPADVRRYALASAYQPWLGLHLKGEIAAVDRLHGPDESDTEVHLQVVLDF